MNVVIGIDPHKASHTAVAIDEAEDEVSSVKVRATRRQVDQLLGWAEPFEKRTWAIESAGGMGYLLAQQLVARGEDGPRCAGHLGLSHPGARHGALEQERPQRRPLGRHRCLSGSEPAQRRGGRPRRGPAPLGQAQRGPRQSCAPGWSAASMRSWPSSLRAELPRKSTFLTPRRLLAKLTPETPAEQVRYDLALELLDDVRRLDAQLKESHRRIRVAVRASGTSVTDLYGVGPIIAAQLIGYTGDIRRFANRDAFASYNGTAPIECSSGGRVVHRLSRRGNRKLNHAIHMAAIMPDPPEPDSEGRVYFERKVAEGKTKKEAIRSLKRQISNAVYRQLLLDAR